CARDAAVGSTPPEFFDFW
nr:immunoglobulin heavy chain junction region [Macaca mulatta]MOV41984.1 immunoglobulin heavy chain junction region [Macaca mulatta]MOV46271.1 immunoglobulin heavy chain junction region [Macaca mulatta]MOV47250.1 immunoglobulin heavy chain junction region [Macaca mulatta]